MYKGLIKFISCFIPFKSLRKKFRKHFLSKKIPYITSEYYGKIYMPYYPDIKFYDENPEIYNKEGKKLDLFFLRDEISSHQAYYVSKYFLWDKYNIGLKTHFYAHKAILETMGCPQKRYGIFIESEKIIPEQYDIFKTHKGIEKDFDDIFTYSENLLNTLSNAKFFPLASSVWYGNEYFNGVKDPTVLDENLYKQKTKDVSMICSAKLMTEMHKIRHRIASDALNSGKVDLYGGFLNGKMFPFKSDTLKEYRYQIVVENDIAPYYFTEKIMDCFVSMTVPIYLGATKIGDFFNLDGIIQIEKDCDVEKVLRECTKQEYERREKAILENYQRALKFVNLLDYFYETFFLDKK